MAHLLDCTVDIRVTYKGKPYIKSIPTDEYNWQWDAGKAVGEINFAILEDIRTEEPELKPCPFCGRGASPLEQEAICPPYSCRVRCPCGAMGPKGRNGHESRELWNRRA